MERCGERAERAKAETMSAVYTRHHIRIVTDNQANCGLNREKKRKEASQGRIDLRAGIEEKRRPIKWPAVIAVRMDESEFCFAERGGGIFSGMDAFIELVHKLRS